MRLLNDVHISQDKYLFIRENKEIIDIFPNIKI